MTPERARAPSRARTSHERPKARTPSSVSRPTQSGSTSPGDGLERTALDVGLETEQEPQEEHGRARRPGLRARGRRIGDRERRLASRVAGEDLRQRPLEPARRLDQPLGDLPGIVPATRPRETPGAERRVVGPHGAVVVAQRVVRRVVGRHRADAPAGPERLAHERVRGRLDALGRHDPAPEQVADVRGERVDRLLVPVERERVGAALLDPERLVEAALQLGRLALEPRRQRRVVPDLPRQLRQTHLRVVDVPLHLDRRDRRPGEGAVVEALRVAGVLPRLVLEPALGAALVLDEAVAVAVAVLVDPLERGERRRLQALDRRRRRPSSATPPRAGRGRAASRRRCRSRTGTTSRPPARAGARG